MSYLHDAGIKVPTKQPEEEFILNYGSMMVGRQVNFLSTLYKPELLGKRSPQLRKYPY